MEDRGLFLAAFAAVPVDVAGEVHKLFLGAESLATRLEALRRGNGGKLTGLRLSIRKDGNYRYARYEVGVPKKNRKK